MVSISGDWGGRGGLGQSPVETFLPVAAGGQFDDDDGPTMQHIMLCHVAMPMVNCSSNATVAMTHQDWGLVIG